MAHSETIHVSYRMDIGLNNHSLNHDSHDSPTISDTSFGMSGNELSSKAHKRIAGQRVFVNRSLEMGKIKFFGFDMDYTLAVYKSPQYEALGFKLILERLVKIGYPAELTQFPYDHTFPVRGLWFDNFYGNLLKVDAYGNILVAVHGQQFLKPSEVEEMYPNKFIQLSEDRIYVLNTLFNLPETVILSSLISYFDNAPNSKREKTGIRIGDLFMSYKSIFQDVRGAVDWVHAHGDFKQITIDKIEDLVHKDPRLPTLLDNLRAASRKTFLVTNSDYGYSNKIMSYLLNSSERDWTSYFDYIIVDARKPMWFAEGTVFRQVDKTSGVLKIGVHTGPLQAGQVYAGGSCQVFSELVNARGKEVMYVGDHIFGDVLRSKKGRGWRTFLIVPEIVHELRVWTDRRELFAQLEALDKNIAELFLNMDIGSTNRPEGLINNLKRQMLEVAHRMDQSYGMTGSLFRCGARKTFFSSQVERYADLYGGSCCNLIYYPLFYFFRAQPMLMPHESTVTHEQHGPLDFSGVNDISSRDRLQLSNRKNSQVQTVATEELQQQREQSPSSSVAPRKSSRASEDSAPDVPAVVSRAKTPRQSTFVHDEHSDEESPPRQRLEPTKEQTMASNSTTDASNEDARGDEETDPSMSQVRVAGYEDVVVAQKPVIENLPKQ